MRYPDQGRIQGGAGLVVKFLLQYWFSKDMGVNAENPLGCIYDYQKVEYFPKASWFRGCKIS